MRKMLFGLILALAAVAAIMVSPRPVEADANPPVSAQQAVAHASVLALLGQEPPASNLSPWRAKIDLAADRCECPAERPICCPNRTCAVSTSECPRP